MAKIGDLVSILKIDNKVVKNPEWWNTTHKLKKEVKHYNTYKTIKANANFKSSFRISGSGNDTFEKNKNKYPEFAEWNPIFRKSNTIILFNKKNNFE